LHAVPIRVVNLKYIPTGSSWKFLVLISRQLGWQLRYGKLQQPQFMWGAGSMALLVGECRHCYVQVCLRRMSRRWPIQIFSEALRVKRHGTSTLLAEREGMEYSRNAFFLVAAYS
jgi:hypothetical protein